MGRFADPVPALVAAAATGRLSCRTGALVSHITTDGAGRATGVVFHDRHTGSMHSVRAPLIFLCASTLESTRILLTTRLEQGLGDKDPRELGRNLMDHAGIKAEGSGPGIDWGDQHDEPGRCVYLPRYDRRANSETGRGFGVRVYRTPAASGRSYFVAVADAEMLPRPDNRVRLSTRKNKFGLPILNIDCTHGPHEAALVAPIREALSELMSLCDVKLDNPGPLNFGAPGSNVHECGTARMGEDPATSVLSPFNECWDLPGVRVTDGSCFPSQGIQNPTLTILAITARAVDAAVKAAR
jgi:choline dehydrogenase-like flavoprotein